MGEETRHGEVLPGGMQVRPLLLSDAIAHAARFHGETGIVARDADGRIERATYRETEPRCRALAAALADLGIGTGERVGSLAWNTLRHFELFYGVSGAGIVLHTANPRLFPEQIAYTINHAGDRLLFYDAGTAALVAAIAPQLETVERFVFLGAAGNVPSDGPADPLVYEELIRRDPLAHWPAFEENAGATLCYTSGTTGAPKGVLDSHRGSVLQAMTIQGGNAFGFGRYDVLMPIAPLFHCNGWGIPYAAPMAGAKLVLPGRDMTAAGLQELAAAEGVTMAFGVPTVFLSLLRHLDDNGLAIPSLKLLGCGGSAPPALMIEAWRERHGVEFVHPWGMTETTAGATFSKAHPEADAATRREVLTTQGLPAFGCDIELVGDDGAILPMDGESVGNLRATGHWIADSYFRDDRPATDAAGRLLTGDVGVMRPDGHMLITDRDKDVIKSGGEWISSIALENEAVGHPEVEEAAVIAVAHPRWQERPLLVVVRRPDSQIAGAEIIEWLGPRVPRWWLPDDVVFVDDIPHTATGKIRKTELREMFRDHELPDAKTERESA